MRPETHLLLPSLPTQIPTKLALVVHEVSFKNTDYLSPNKSPSAMALFSHFIDELSEIHMVRQ